MNNAPATTDTLLPPNATAFERAIVAAAARACDVPVPIRALWSVDDCPLRLLPWLAWAMNMQTWQSDWPEAIKRSRIRSAIDVHRRRGTARSVRVVVESFGADIALREWYQMEPMGTPMTFNVTLSIGDSLPQTAQFQRDIIQAIELTRPVSRHYELVATTDADTRIGVLAAAQAITYRRLNLLD
tara:strand:+ start:1236 stop:1790 length:555 start_codon:yes stop_codon:yes gene_type:complete